MVTVFLLRYKTFIFGLVTFQKLISNFPVITGDDVESTVNAHLEELDLPKGKEVSYFIVTRSTDFSDHPRKHKFSFSNFKLEPG